MVVGCVLMVVWVGLCPRSGEPRVRLAVVAGCGGLEVKARHFVGFLALDYALFRPLQHHSFLRTATPTIWTFTHIPS